MYLMHNIEYKSWKMNKRNLKSWLSNVYIGLMFIFPMVLYSAMPVNP